LEWIGPINYNRPTQIFVFSFEVSAGTVPYPLLKMKTLQVRYRIPSATGMGIGNFR